MKNIKTVTYNLFVVSYCNYVIIHCRFSYVNWLKWLEEFRMLNTTNSLDACAMYKWIVCRRSDAFMHLHRDVIRHTPFDLVFTCITWAHNPLFDCVGIRCNTIPSAFRTLLVRRLTRMPLQFWYEYRFPHLWLWLWSIGISIALTSFGIMHLNGSKTILMDHPLHNFI